MSESSPVIKLKAKERGQGLVEFALILPVFLLLVWGIVEFGRLLVMYTEVSNAAREAVRYGVARGLPGDVAHPTDCDGIARQGSAVTGLVSLDGDCSDGVCDFEIGYDHGDGAVFGYCADSPQPDVRPGDRMVITVTHQIQPLVLFQNAGPFELSFTAARTIVGAGIEMEAIGEVGGVTQAPTLEFHLVTTSTCEGFFTWSEIPDADVYLLYRTVPSPFYVLGSTTQDFERYPITDTLSRPTLDNGLGFQVLGSNTGGNGPLSNLVTIGGCAELLPAPDPFTLTVTQTNPTCAGIFSWGAVGGALGYHLYEATGGQVISTTATNADWAPLSNGQVYTVRAYDADNEGYASAPLTVSGCALEAPTVSLITDQKTPPCQGHLTWNIVADATSYNVYRDDSPLDTVTSPRYPAALSIGVANGQWFEVTAYNDGTGESPYSTPVTVTECWEGKTVDVTYWLHSTPTPPNWHGPAPPPLTMDERAPSHDTLYNYNGDDPLKPGREVLKGGGTPPGEIDTSDYLMWHSPSPSVPMSFENNATLTVWGRNSHNVAVVATARLYTRVGSTYTLRGTATRQMLAYEGAPPNDWVPLTFTFATTGVQWPAGSELVVWLTSDNNQSLEFAYDTISYSSNLTFQGKW